MSAFAIKYDDMMRKLREDGITLKKIDTVFENTPEFEALWSTYESSDDPMYNICTEDDGKTHTFYRIYLPTPNTIDQTVRTPNNG